jgi:hypothetical protein
MCATEAIKTLIAIVYGLFIANRSNWLGLLLGGWKYGKALR